MKFITSLFASWWKSMLGLFVALLIFGLGVLLERDAVITVFLYALLVSVVWIGISFLFQLFNKKWLAAIAQALITVPIVSYVLLIFALSPPDYFASHLSIPEGIDIDTPLISGNVEGELDRTSFVLEAGFQPGIYRYATTYVPNGSGVIYAKAFELTQEYRLSGERMKTRSAVKVSAEDKGVKSAEFTIYEGNWGEKYGARIELWFEFDSGKQVLIGSRNYIVDGWQR
jgi:hypothetical protein